MTFQKGRRPSPAFIIAIVALFVALGGTALAGVVINGSELKNRSVGGVKLKNHTITAGKVKLHSLHGGDLSNGAIGTNQISNGAIKTNQISNGAIGTNQINTSEVQERVTGSCTGVTGAIGAIAATGTVTCNPSAPAEFGTAVPPNGVTVHTSVTPIVSKSLPSGSYLATANVHAIVVATTGQTVTISCGLGNDNGTNVGSLATLTFPASTLLQTNIPLTLAIPAGSTTAAVTCEYSAVPSTPAPTVLGASTLNAIQTSSNS
jgi:hypothetical protein